MAKLKTKFDSLVKMKKVKIDEIERQILKINSQISNIQTEIEILTKEMNEYEYPKGGSFALVAQFKMAINGFLYQINEKKKNLNFLENQKSILKNQLKDYNLEYEKMKYLQGEEIKKYLAKIKEKEAKDLDEIALMLYKG